MKIPSAFEAMHSRRSIRRYTPEPISKETLEQILAPTMSAPSAGDARPWRFVVIRSRATLDRLQAEMPGMDMLREAQAAIAVCADLKAEKFKGFWPQDCSAATQNLLLAAHALGLGAVWLGIFPIEDRIQVLQRTLGLPADVVPLSLVSLGHPNESLPAENRFDPKLIHWETWTA